MISAFFLIGRSMPKRLERPALSLAEEAAPADEQEETARQAPPGRRPGLTARQSAPEGRVP